MATLSMDRKEFLDNMKDFLKNESIWLQNLTQYLGLNINDLPEIIKLNPGKVVSCPLNNEHRMPEDSLDRHVVKCSSKYEDYPIFTAGEDRTNDSSSCKSTLAELTLSELSHDDSYLDVQTSSSKRLIELLSAERDAKRRRAAYRKKGVHTNKKSYNEILKELIENEMKTLECSLKIEELPESNINLVNDPVERTEGSTVYAGVGKWLYHGNPYKRWMTIADEEKEFFKTDSDEKYKHSKHSSRSARYRTDEQFTDRHRSKHSTNRNDRSRSYRDEPRRFEKRKRHRSRSGLSHSFSIDPSHHKRISRISPISSQANAPSKISKESKTFTHSNKYTSESSETLGKHSYETTCSIEEKTRIPEKKLKYKSNEKSPEDRYHSSSHSDSNRKRHHKKKKSKKKHAKKKKRHSSSHENSE